MSHTNSQKFEHELSGINWDDVLSSYDPQATYTLFHNKFMNVYNRCFPLKRFKVSPYSDRLPWLSESLKRSIAHKNDLYKKSIKTKDPQLVSTYKKYKDKLSKILRNMERKRYAYQFAEHKSDLKKSWNVL